MHWIYEDGSIVQLVSLSLVAYRMNLMIERLTLSVQMEINGFPPPVWWLMEGFLRWSDILIYHTLEEKAGALKLTGLPFCLNIVVQRLRMGCSEDFIDTLWQTIYDIFVLSLLLDLTPGCISTSDLFRSEIQLCTKS